MYVSALSAHTTFCQHRTAYSNVDGGQPLCGCWELNLCPSEEQPVLLTAGPPFQPQYFFIFVYDWSIYMATFIPEEGIRV